MLGRLRRKPASMNPRPVPRLRPCAAILFAPSRRRDVSLSGNSLSALAREDEINEGLSIETLGDPSLAGACFSLVAGRGCHRFSRHGCAFGDETRERLTA